MLLNLLILKFAADAVSQTLRHLCLEVEKGLFKLAKIRRPEHGFSQIHLNKRRKLEVL